MDLIDFLITALLVIAGLLFVSVFVLLYVAIWMVDQGTADKLYGTAFVNFLLALVATLVSRELAE